MGLFSDHQMMQNDKTLVQAITCHLQGRQVLTTESWWFNKIWTKLTPFLIYFLEFYRKQKQKQKFALPV